MAEVAEVSEVAIVAMVAMVAVVRGNRTAKSRNCRVEARIEPQGDFMGALKWAGGVRSGWTRTS